ncbi:hypothetical protein [Klebsiella pneumoniae]
MTTEKPESKLYESLPQPNEVKPITVDTFSPWVIPVARIKRFNGVKNSPEIMAVYSHLLGWKKTTGEIRPSQQYIADCCCMGLSTVQKKVKVLVKMGWITATPARKPGSKEISHTDYTVKDPEEILAEQNAGLSQQGDAVVTIAKNHQPKAEESENGAQSVTVAPVPATDDPEQQSGVPQSAGDSCDDVSANDAVNASTQYTDEQLRTKLRKWRNWGLDDEARAFCLSQGVNDDTDSMALFIQRYQMPVLHQIPGEIPQWDEKIPF